MNAQHRNIHRGDCVKFNKMKNIQADINDAVIELYSDKRLLVFDCNGVVDYNEESIILDLGNRKLKILGEELVVDSFVFDQTDIRGRITSLEFIGGSYD
jgi:hypothetical protein